MSQSPGHEKWPEHQIRESPVSDHVTIELDGEIIGDSRSAIRVDEDGSPTRYYFPRTDVSMNRLERTETTSTCPFKGTANYFSLSTTAGKLEDAVWSYEDPFDEHQALKSRVAFYDDKYRNIHVRVG